MNSSSLISPSDYTGTKSGNRFTVYALVANHQIRYIGITSQELSRRLSQHSQDAKREYRKDHKTNWIRKCASDGVRIEIKPIRIGLCLESSQRIEKQIIKRLRHQVVNVHEGGSSGYGGLPPDAKVRHSESGKRHYRNMRQDKRERMLTRLKNMRNAKARIREQRIEAGLLEREPEFVRHYPLEFGVRVKATGETHFHDLTSVRYAAKALGLIMKYCT